IVAEKVRELSAKFNKGKRIDVINQKLSYLVHCSDPDAIDSIAPMAYGNLALDLLLKNISERLVVLRNGHYDNVSLVTVTATKTRVNVKEQYNTERLRPQYASFDMRPLFLMTNQVG